MIIQRINYNKYSSEVLEQLKKGAFLTVKYGNEINTMTIGWGTLGYIWNKPIFMVAIRYSRHTYKLLENAKEFTVSIPLNNNLKKELSYCGTKSGRDVNKFEQCNLSILEGQKVSTPIIGECELHYECKVVYQQVMEPATLDKKIKNHSYSNNDYHVLYYGEILDAYLLKK